MKSEKRRPFRLAGLLALCICVGLPFAAAAQSTGIDPAALQLLRASTDFVASRQQFRADTRNTIEVVLASGQKIQFAHTARLSVQRPDRLRAERTGDLVEQLFVYDGKSITLANRADKYYATIDAPPTIEAMLDFARDTMDIIAPAGDLVYANAYDILMTDVSSGIVVGKGIVEGVRCDHLAFRAPHVDWQIWIQEGSQPLPRKLVVTTRDVVNAPQFTVVISRWNLKPAFDAQTFAFAPPGNAKKIDFVPVATR